jgi:hypothetical protein
LSPLAALAALLLSAAPRPILVRLGEADLPLHIELEVRAGAPDGPEPSRASAEEPSGMGGGPLPLAWRSGPDGALVASAVTPALLAEVRLEPAPGGARRIEVVLRWRREAGLERAALRLGWPGDWPGAVGRDLQPRPLDAPLRTGRGTPLLAWAGPALLVGGPGLVAAALVPGRGGRGLDAALFLDDAAERPFATYRECLETLPRMDGQAANAWADLERKRAWPKAPRHPGEVDRLVATLYPRRAGSAGPLLPQRWARGARAALVLTDHADRTSAAALRAVLYGHSDLRAEGGRGAGVLGRGLAITRSFFAFGGPGTLEEPAVASLADQLVAAGSEVALHSVSDLPDDRDTVRAGLQAAARFEPRTWIDHEPYLNCEALSARGAGTEGPYGVRQVLLEGGIRWGWAAGDVAGFQRVEVADLFQVAPPGLPSPVLFPLPADPRLWIFQSSFFYAPPRELAAALSDAALDRLERGQGLFVGHSYLGAGPAETRGQAATSRLAVRPAPGGGLLIDPDLDVALARLAGRVARGQLASLTLDDAAGRLVALGDVEVRYREDGSAEIVNHGWRALPGLTLATPVPGLDWWVDGQPAQGDPTGRRVWFDLAPGGSRVVRATLLSAPVPLLAPAGP